MVENTETKKANQLKIIIIGDQAVGKSSLLMRYCDDKFSLSMMGTAGIDYKKKVFSHKNKTLNVIFYDSAGHERFRHMTKQHYQGAKGIVLAYDVTDYNSFSNVNEWMNTIKQNADSNAEIMLIGNKTDLINERKVSLDDGIELSKKYNVELFETSAKSGDNTVKAFNSIIVKILENEALNKDIKYKEDGTKNDNNENNTENKDNNKIVINNNNGKSKPNKGGCFKCG